MHDASRLPGVIGPAGYFTLAFGSIVGSGWVMVLGEWLSSAGPGGSALAFLCGGLLMTCVVVCFAELAARMPHAGGEFRYVLESFGRPLAFAVGWYLALGLVAFTAFEGIAFAWLMEAMWPALRGAPLYSLFGHEITIGGLLLGIGGAIFFAGVNYLGTATAVWLQQVVTFAFLVVVCAVIGAGFVLGDAANLRPAFASLGSSSWTIGALWIFGTSAIFLNGFQTALYAIEERRAGMAVRQVVLPMIGGVATAVAFYVCIVLSAARAAPWATIASADLPAAFAFGKLTGSGFLTITVLVIATISLLKSWNAYVLGSARMLVAQAQTAMLPGALARVHPRFGSPSISVASILVLNVLGVLLGRGAIVAIVNMSAIVSAFSYVLCMFALLRLRKLERAQAASFTAPGGTVFVACTTAGVTAMALFVAYEPLLRGGESFPIEWVLLGAWGILGAAFWRLYGRRVRAAASATTGKISREGRSAV